MKKILLLLFFIITNMEIIQLSAYCFYNHSNEKIRINIFSGKTTKFFGFDKAYYWLSPKGGKSCRNWKKIDKNNRKKEWYFTAYTKSFKRLGEGYFPIGGAIYFSGWYKDEFSISYDGKEWEYWKKPWKHKKQPWKTYKH